MHFCAYNENSHIVYKHRFNFMLSKVFIWYWIDIFKLLVRIIGTIKYIKNQYTTKPLSTFKEMAILANTESWNR